MSTSKPPDSPEPPVGPTGDASSSTPTASAAPSAPPAAAPKPPAKPVADEPPPKKWAKPGDLPPDGVKLPPKGAAGAKADDKPSANVDEIPKPPPWWKTLRAEPPIYIRIGLGAGCVAFLFFLWWLATTGGDPVMSPNVMPSPGKVFGSLDRLLERQLLDNTLATLERVLKGILSASVIGVGLGILAGAHRGVNSFLMPLVIFLRSVPMGALAPLTLILFGFEEPQKTRFIFLAVVAFVFSDTLKAISSVPERYIETAQTLGASYFQIIRKVLVPLALPDIVTSLRFQFGLALGYIMLVEEINTEYGLGRLIFGSQQRGIPEHVWLLLFIIAAIAFTIDLLLRTIQRGVFTWRKDL